MTDVDMISSDSHIVEPPVSDGRPVHNKSRSRPWLASSLLRAARKTMAFGWSEVNVPRRAPVVPSSSTTPAVPERISRFPGSNMAAEACDADRATPAKNPSDAKAHQKRETDDMGLRWRAYQAESSAAELRDGAQEIWWS